MMGLPITRSDLKWLVVMFFAIVVAYRVAFFLYGFIGLSLSVVLLFPIVYFIVLILIRRYRNDVIRRWKNGHPDMAEDRMPDWREGLSKWWSGL